MRADSGGVGPGLRRLFIFPALDPYEEVAFFGLCVFLKKNERATRPKTTPPGPPACFGEGRVARLAWRFLREQRRR